MSLDQNIEILKNRYIDAVLSGKRSDAVQIVFDSQKRGVDIYKIYIDIISESQASIGEMWHKGIINIAEEHLATVTTLEVMDQLRLYNMNNRRSIGFKALVAPVEKDDHIVGARMMSDFLIMDGWEVDFLGGSTPTQDLVEFIKIKPVDLVVLSLTNIEFQSNAILMTNALSSIMPKPKILLGGLAVKSSKININLMKCDSITSSVLEGVNEARRLVGLSREKLSLEEHLRVIGKRMRIARINKQLTQKDLAKASGLDRTYISSVEQGKQNMTFSAILRISEALGVEVVDLMKSSRNIIDL